MVKLLYFFVLDAFCFLHLKKNVEEAEKASASEAKKRPAANVIEHDRSDQAYDQDQEPVDHSVHWSGLIIANLWQVQPDDRTWTKLEAEEKNDREYIKNRINLDNLHEDPHAEHADYAEDLRADH